MAEQVAWVGLGNMGRGMVRNIVEKYPLQSPLILNNRTAARAQSFATTFPPSKVIVATSLEAVSAASVIIICVSDDAAIRTTIDSILSYSPSPTLFIDCSTVHPSTTASVSSLLIAAGHKFVAMPVFGAPAMADAGVLICVPAGPRSSVELALPFAHAIGSTIIDLSDKPYESASTLKIIGNTFILNMVEQLSESHVLAEKSGLGSEPLHKFIEAIFPGVYTDYSNRMTSGVYYTREEPLFAVDLARKDARHAMDMAKAAGTRLENVEAADRHLVKVKEHSGEKGDMAAIYGAVREEAGLPFENQKRE
ncbi:hypothetical protein V493_05714 [Pseudogymnoascus sp. VKM F-4281 (FW-2241)]|nr:hypothetical protein V493_05714 [Pseudogymnoascus sp. VKM F-4281 (FW-2241)]